MYYHIIIKLKEKNSRKYNVELSELDKTDRVEIVEDIVKPYINKEEFLFDGRMLTINKILSLKIYKTNETSKVLSDRENNKPKEYIWVETRCGVVQRDDCSEEITKQVFKEVKALGGTKKKVKVEKVLNKNKIFIVHGHDNETKLEVARFIEKIGFEAIILHEQASNSQTIIEKIESYTDVGFGVVIYTACDIGAMKLKSNELQDRARQNVVFEHGFLIGKLGRSNVCSLVKGAIETPSDISGVVYTLMDSGHWQIEVAKELKQSGYDVDMNKVI